MWQFDPDDSQGGSDLLEPQLVCEHKVPSEVTELRFLDPQRVVGSFSNGCVALFMYQARVKVRVCVCVVNLSWETMFAFMYNGCREDIHCTIFHFQ